MNKTLRSLMLGEDSTQSIAANPAIHTRLLKQYHRNAWIIIVEYIRYPMGGAERTIAVAFYQGTEQDAINLRPEHMMILEPGETLPSDRGPGGQAVQLYARYRQSVGLPPQELPWAHRNDLERVFIKLGFEREHAEYDLTRQDYLGALMTGRVRELTHWVENNEEDDTWRQVRFLCLDGDRIVALPNTGRIGERFEETMMSKMVPIPKEHFRSMADLTEYIVQFSAEHGFGDAGPDTDPTEAARTRWAAKATAEVLMAGHHKTHRLYPIMNR